MKVLGVEKDMPGVTGEQFGPHLRAEAARVWELFQSGAVREIYFSKDHRRAVLMLECADGDEANRILSTMPLVKEGLIAFDIIPLVPYPGFARLFAKE